MPARSGRRDRPDGVYGAAFVSYEEGSPLTYLELVVARLADARARQVRITDGPLGFASSQPFT